MACREDDGGTDIEAGDQSQDPSLTYSIVWIDEQVKIPHCQRIVAKMSQLSTSIMEFDNVNQCVSALEHLEMHGNNASIIFITSGRLSTEVIPKIHDLSIVKSIIIFCFNLENVRNLRFNKLRNAVTKRRELLTEIEDIICASEETIPFSLHSGSEVQTRSGQSSGAHSFGPMKNLTASKARFFWFSIYHKFLIQVDNQNPTNSKSEMIEVARQKFRGKDKKIADLMKFRDQSFEQNRDEIIEYYAANGFLCPLLNDILTGEDYKLIYRCRYGIRLLCIAIKKNHADFVRQYSNQKLTLYRGQAMRLQEIMELKKQIGVLISFNSFVSTSRSKATAVRFAQNRAEKQKSEPVLMIIHVSAVGNQQTPMADISNYSKFEENEVLLSIGTVFQVLSMDYASAEKLHVIHLSFSEQENSRATEYIKKKYREEYDPTDLKLVFGKILFDLHETELATEFHEDCIKNLKDHEYQKRPIYLNNLGMCYLQNGNVDQALVKFLLAKQIYESRESSRELGACEHNIAACYYKKQKYAEAEQQAQNAQAKRVSAEEQVETLNLLGLINIERMNIDAALSYFKIAFEILKDNFGSGYMSHPLTGETFNNIGLIDLRQMRYIDADDNFKKAVEIFELHYGTHHTKKLKSNERLALCGSNQFFESFESFSKSIVSLDLSKSSRYRYFLHIWKCLISTSDFYE